MIHIINELKKRFKNQRIDDSSLDAERLWESISNDLDIVDRKRTWTNWKSWTLLLSFFLVGFFGYLYNQIKNSSALDSIKKEEIILPAVTKNYEISTINEGIGEVQEKYKRDKTSNDKQQLVDEKNKQEKSATIKSTKKPAKEGKGLRKNFNRLELIKENRSEFFNQIEFKDQVNSVSQDNVNYHINKANDKGFSSKINVDHFEVEELNDSIELSHMDNKALLERDGEQISVVPNLPTIIPKVLNAHTRVLKSIPNLPSDHSRKTRNEIQWRIGVHSGVNTNRMHFSGGSNMGLLDTMNASQKNVLGFSNILRLGVKIPNGILLNTALEYNNIWTKFDYSENRPIEVFRNNALLKVWIDEMTGDTISSNYGDTLINANASKKIIHYNNFIRYSLPIEIGYEKSLGNWSYGISAGAVISMTNKQLGRGLRSSGDISSFNNNAPHVPYKNIDVAFRLRPFLAYNIDRCWSLSLESQWTWNKRKNYDNSDIGISISQYNLNVGLIYKL